MIRARLTLGVVVAAGIIAALAPVQLGAQAPGTLTVAWNPSGTALDPREPTTFLTRATAYEGAFLVYDGLVGLRGEMRIVPELATSWYVSPDGRTWVFKIRSGVSFQDGEPLTAQAVADALQRELDPHVNRANRPLWDPIASASASDASTVRIVTREPYAGLLNTLAHGSGLVARRITSAQERGGATPPGVGTGPYHVERWEAGKELDLVRNGRYWGERPGFERVALRIVADPASRAAMIRDGGAQVANGISPDQVAALARLPGTSVTIRPTLRTFGMAINLTRAALQDLRVRQALNYAVNKDLLVNALFRGYASVLHSPLAAQSSGYADLGPWPYDPPRSRRLLEDAGWKPAPPIGVRVRDGKALELTLLTPRGVFPRDVEVTETLADYLRNVGFEIHFLYADSGALWDQLLVAPDRYKWDLVFLGFDPVNGDGGFQLNALYRSNPDPHRAPVIRNVTWYANPQVDAWLSDGNRVAEPRLRAEVYAHAARQVWNDAPYLWLYAENLIVATRNVHGVEVMPTGVTLLRSARP